MDLNTVTEIITPADRKSLPSPAQGDAYLAGGTWLFSEPQPNLKRLVDLTSLGWQPLTASGQGLTIAATCPIATLAAFDPPAAWPAGQLILQSCRALLGSFKVWNMATAGGNLCMALPAGPIAALATALEAECLIWSGTTERREKAENFITGPQQTILAPGEILREIKIPASALKARTAFRQISLNPLGRSGALLIGTRTDIFALTITAATPHPVRLTFPQPPDTATLLQHLDAAIPPEKYYDDIHGRPAWRRHVTRILAEQIRQELTQ